MEVAKHRSVFSNEYNNLHFLYKREVDFSKGKAEHTNQGFLY